VLNNRRSITGAGSKEEPDSCYAEGHQVVQQAHSRSSRWRCWGRTCTTWCVWGG
jgi:hypothetical protein